MVSSVHETVLQEIQNNKPKLEILNDLLVSFMAVTLNEITNCDDKDKEALINYSVNQLNNGVNLMEKCLKIHKETLRKTA